MGSTLFPPLLNIICGLVLTLFLLEKIADARSSVKRIQNNIAPYYSLLGYVAIALGIVNLIDRWFVYIPLFTGSYPQSIFAILSGVLLVAMSTRPPQWTQSARSLLPYAGYVGVLALIAGLYAL